MIDITMQMARNYTKTEKLLLRKLIDTSLQEGMLQVNVTKKDLLSIHEHYEKVIFKVLQNAILIEEKGVKIYFQAVEQVVVSEQKAMFSLHKNLFDQPYASYLQNILKLQKKSSIGIYNRLVKVNALCIAMNMEDSKELFDCQGLYPRFYDFEKNVLLPIKEDFYENTGFIFCYTKIKNAAYDNSKVVAMEYSLLYKSKGLVESHLPDYIMRTVFKSAFQLQNEIYEFIEEVGIKNMFNEYFFTPALFIKLNKLQPDIRIEINEHLYITCSKDREVKIELFR